MPAAAVAVKEQFSPYPAEDEVFKVASAFDLASAIVSEAYALHETGEGDLAKLGFYSAMTQLRLAGEAYMATAEYRSLILQGRETLQADLAAPVLDDERVRWEIARCADEIRECSAIPDGLRGPLVKALGKMLEYGASVRGVVALATIAERS
jgi:hypothetical protein